MEQRLIYEAVGYVSLDSDKEKGEIYFSTEEAAIQFIGKYLGGQGYARPRFVHTKKVYKSLEDYENDMENELQ